MFNRFLDSYCNPENELYSYVCRIATNGLEKEESSKDRITDHIAWLKKASYIRQNFIKSIGGLDFEKTDLKPEYRGDIDKGEYIIKKVIFQSLPSFYVTANLYIPKGIKEPVPGILFSCGHSKAAKAEYKYQLAAIELVLNDMVVLVVDPPGQGEIIQMPDRHDIDWGVREHSYIGLTCTLAGMNIARYFIWNLIRSVDFLYSLDFVDKNRIGASGNSGGGTQTSYISLVDDRIKAAAPGCYINGRKQYLPRGHAHDSEQNIYNCMNFGLDYGDFISCFAPKPFRLLSQQYDFFPIEGTLYSINRAKKIYSLFNSEESADIVIDKNMHGLSDKLRGGLVDLFARHFYNRKPKTIDPVPYAETEKSLQCTNSGCVFGEIEDAISLDKIVYKDYILKKNEAPEITKSISKVFRINDKPQRPIEKRINPFDFDGYKAEKVFWLNSYKITNAGIYLYGNETNKVSMVIFENGTDEIVQRKDEILQLLKIGDVFIIDLSGVGAVKPARINNSTYYGMYGTIHKICSDLLMAGSSLMEMWINDIIQAGLLCEKEIEIIAYGKMQPAAMLATYLSYRACRFKTSGEKVDFEKIMNCRAGFVPELEVYGLTANIDFDEVSFILSK